MRILFYGFGPGWRVAPCEDGHRCEFTTDERLLHDADAVVFHPTLLAGLDPDAKRPGECWVAWCMESAVTVPAIADPATLTKFDIVMSYRRGADIWVPYLSAAIVAGLMTPPRPKTAPFPVARVQSSPYDRSGRNRYAVELMRRIKVASYGKVARTADWPEDGAIDASIYSAQGQADKIAVLARHKFTLAFENSIAEDYVTEKLFHALVAGSVPVYLGAPNVADFAPDAHSYIDTRDFAGPAELAAYLNHLDSHDGDYERYLEWKRTGPTGSFRRLCAESHPRPFCRLAEIVARSA